MGLDMYLERKTYVRNSSHMKDEERHIIVIYGPEEKNIDTSKVSHIVESVGQWRKTNAIHRWFVQNVQDGEDDCNEYEVSKEQLSQLYNLCIQVVEGSILVDGTITNGYSSSNGSSKVISNPELAAKLLPRAEGFFFGSTDYDEWYMQDLKDTIEILKPIVEREHDSASYHYSSSW